MNSAIEPLALKLLHEGIELSKYDLAFRARCDQRTAQRILKKFHAEGRIKIASWAPIYTKRIPVYKVGGTDAPKPAPVPPAEAQAKRRKNPDVRAREAAIKRNDRTRRKYGIHTPEATVQGVCVAVGW